MNSSLTGVDQWPNVARENITTFDQWWETVDRKCFNQGYGWLDKVTAEMAFHAGLAIGNKKPAPESGSVLEPVAGKFKAIRIGSSASLPIVQPEQRPACA